MRNRFFVSAVTAIALASFFDIVAGAQAPSRGLAPEWGSAGGPLADCAATSRFIDQLKAGLPKQEERIRNQEKVLRAAEADYAAAVEELKTLAVDQLKGAATDYVGKGQVLKARINALKHLSKEDRLAWLQQYKELEKIGETFSKGKKIFDEGAKFGDAIREQSVDLQKAASFFEETGLNDEAAKLVAQLGAGIAGKAAVESAILVRDVALASGNFYVTNRDVTRFQQDLNDLKAAQSAIKDKIASHQEVIDSICAPKAPVRTNDSTQMVRRPEPPAATPAAASAPSPSPAPAPAKPASAPDATPQKSGGGSTKTAVILIGAAVGGGLIAGTALKQQQEANSSSGSSSGGSSSGGSSGGGGSTTTTITNTAITCVQGSGAAANCNGTLTARIGPSVSAGTAITVILQPSSITGHATATGSGSGQTVTFTFTSASIVGCRTPQTSASFVLSSGSIIASATGNYAVTCR